jgi:hypothetical protein
MWAEEGDRLLHLLREAELHGTIKSVRSRNRSTYCGPD